MRYYTFFMVMGLGALGYAQWTWTDVRGSAQYDDARAVSTPTPYGSYTAGEAGATVDGQPYAGAGDVLLIRHAYAGAPQWTRLAGSSNTDFATAVAADAGANAYVAGLTSGAFDGETNAGGSAYFLIKYLPDGTRAWSRIRGAAAGTTAAALAVPAAPLLVLAGDTAGALDGQPFAGMVDTLLCAWTPDGTQLWTRVRGTATGEWLRAVAVRDSLVCAAGSCLGSMDGQPFVGREDALLMAYDTNGTWRWTRTRGSDDDDTVTGVALDCASNIYLTGFTFGAFDGQVNRGGADIFLIKYDAAGTHQWTRFRGTPANDCAAAVSVDDGGTVFVAGFTYGALDGQTNAGGADAVLCAYAPDGTWQWTALRGSASDDFAQAVAIDTAGGLARVTGYTYGVLAGQPNAGNADAFTLEYLIPEPAPLMALGAATCLLRRARRRGSPSQRCP